MAFGFDTAGNIVNDAAVELGLLPFSGKLADPFASLDANIGQLCQFMKSVGQDLLNAKQWTQFQQSYVFTTAVPSLAHYPLPSDFQMMIDQTGWNRTNRLPLGGPLSPQEWEYFKARLVGVVFTVLFRPMQQQLWLYPDTNTPGGYVISFEYRSRFWAQSATAQVSLANLWGPWEPGATHGLGDIVTNGGAIYVSTVASTSGTYSPTGTGNDIDDGGVTWNYVSASGQEFPTASTDLVLFDRQLFLRGLKLAWRKEKGFDTSAAQDEFDSTLAQVMGNDAAAPVLSLNSSAFEEPLLGEGNIPLTGFGS